jgi:hypothetical protein
MDLGVYAGEGAGKIIRTIKKKAPDIPRFHTIGYGSLLMNQLGAVAMPSRLAHINTIPCMNAHCIREVRALEDRELNCRIVRDRLHPYGTGSGSCYDNLPGTIL